MTTTKDTLAVIEQLVGALERMHLWADSQADAQSKGGHATFDLMLLREERDAVLTALTAGREALATQGAEVQNRCVSELLAFAERNPSTYIFHGWDGSRVAKYLRLLTTTPQPSPVAQPTILPELLTDQGVHLAMVRGQIAKISMLQCAHSHGETAVAEYRALTENTVIQALGKAQGESDALRSIKQEAETGLVIGDEIGMRDALEHILKEADGYFGIATHPQSSEPMTEQEYAILTKNGTKAWAGVNAQDLRDGSEPAPCAAGAMCIDCQPRCADGSCPNATRATSQPAPSTAVEHLTRKQVDAVVYECREDGDDTTYDIVNTAIQFYLDTQHAAQPAQEEVQDLVAALLHPARWHDLTDEQLDRAAALLQSTALPVGELTDGQILDAMRTVKQIDPTKEGWIERQRILMGRAVLAAAKEQPAQGLTRENWRRIK